MQLLTPEQSKWLLAGAGDAAKWIVSTITLACILWVGRTIKSLPERIIAPVLVRLTEHEAADLLFQEKTDARLAAREKFESETARTLHRIESGMQPRRQAHGD